MLFLVSVLIPLLLGTAVLGQFPDRRFEQSQLQLPVPAINPSQIIPPHQLPYQAMIYLSWGNESYGAYLMCDAVLISPEWLLTAQSCPNIFRPAFPSSLSEPIEVFLGCDKIPVTEKRRRKEECQSGVKRRVVRQFPGPRVQIGNRTQDSDLLLLKLDKAVESSANIKPIELPEVGTSWTDRMAVVSGYGEVPSIDRPWYVQERGLPHTLQYTKLPILSKRDCLAMFKKNLPLDWYNDSLMSYQKLRLEVAPETILCAEFEIRGFRGCLGHSGGPLAVCATPLTSGGQQLCEGNRWQLAGFYSKSFPHGYMCPSKPERPALLTNVAPFADWIRRTINNN